MNAAEGTPGQPDAEALRRENEELRSQVRELTETLDAIRSGEVDAIVVSQGETNQVYALEGADHPYRVLVEKIQEGALTLSADGTILYANAAFAAMRGLPLSAILGTPLRGHVVPRDREQFDALLETSLTRACRGEMSVCGGSSSVPVMVSMTPLDVNRDTTISVVVTDRRQDYRRLRLQGRILDSVMDAVTAVDPGGTVIYTNAAAERLYGWQASEMIGGSMLDTVVSGAREDEIREVFGRVAVGETWSGERVVRRCDGRCIHVQATRAPVYDDDGALVAVIGTSHDISERVAAERALRESEAKYRRLFDSLDEGFCVIEVLFDEAGSPVDYVFLEANPAFEQQTGLSDAIGRRMRELNPAHEEHWYRIYGEIVKTGEPRRFVESAIPLIGGWYQVYAFPIGGPGENQVAILFNDITEQIRAEASLREYAENLRRSNEDLERFAYVASHDLQEPLRSVVSFSQLLERRYRGQLGEDADEYIDFIVEGGNRMQTLILDLLAFSRVNTTRQQIARTDAEDVLAEVERSLDASLHEAGVTFTHDPLPVVMADPTQLAQVFTNLVSNAIKFRKPETPLRVHVGVRRADGFCEFSVSDNGIGIAPEYFDRIFVIFQRLHTREQYEGTGIGLAIVKRIIDRHGGAIRVESTPGEGTTFFFTLPAA
jgi:PAS domain S-box-containing protein